MTDYHQYVGQDLIIVQELLENVISEKPYDPEFVPPWNYVGNVLHITSYDAEDKFFRFIDQDGRNEEALMTYDFDNGFVIPFREEQDEAVDTGMIIGLL